VYLPALTTLTYKQCGDWPFIWEKRKMPALTELHLVNPRQFHASVAPLLCSFRMDHEMCSLALADFDHSVLDKCSRLESVHLWIDASVRVKQYRRLATLPVTAVTLSSDVAWHPQTANHLKLFTQLTALTLHQEETGDYVSVAPASSLRGQLRLLEVVNASWLDEDDCRELLAFAATGARVTLRDCTTLSDLTRSEFAAEAGASSLEAFDRLFVRVPLNPFPAAPAAVMSVPFCCARRRGRTRRVVEEVTIC
jgi:hypothetical protein